MAIEVRIQHAQVFSSVTAYVLGEWRTRAGHTSTRPSLPQISSVRSALGAVEHNVARIGDARSYADGSCSAGAAVTAALLSINEPQPRQMTPYLVRSLSRLQWPVPQTHWDWDGHPTSRRITTTLFPMLRSAPTNDRMSSGTN